MIARKISFPTDIERSDPMEISTVSNGRRARLRLIPALGEIMPNIRHTKGGTRRARMIKLGTGQ